MSNGINQYIEHLQQRLEHSVLGIIAATALGREAIRLREELERPPAQTLHGTGILGPGDANNAISELTNTLWDMDVSSTQRAAAAWSLGQIGGIQPARELLNRLDALFVQGSGGTLSSGNQDTQEKAIEEAIDVRATLIQSLLQALDEPTMDNLNRFDLQRLRLVSSALLDYMLLKQSDPDLTTAIAMSLARLAVRIQTDILQDILYELLNASEPESTLATVGALSELISAKQENRILDYLYDVQASIVSDDAFNKLEAIRGQPYSPGRRRLLFQLVTQFHYTEQVTQVAGEHMWKEIEQNILRKGGYSL